MRLYRPMQSVWTRLFDIGRMRLRDTSPGVVACALLLLSASVPADASQEMGLVNVVESDPSRPTIVFAGAERGVFKSTDTGATWTATGLTQATVALAIAPGTPSIVYAGTGSGLFRSVDDGTSWSSAGVTDPICSVEIDPAIPTTLYASTCSRIIKSLDGGASWGSVGPTDAPISSVAIAAGPPTILYAGSVGDDGVRVFSSADGGVTWSVASVSNPDPNYVPLWGLSFGLSVDPMMSTTAYVSSWGWKCDNDGCYTIGVISKSTDGGASWFGIDEILHCCSWVSPQVVVSPIAIDPGASSTLYAAWNVACDQFNPSCVEEHWISKSTDGGARWSRISDLSAWALWVDPLTRVLYAATSSGLLRSTDGGVTWSADGTPPPPPPTDTAPPDTSITSAADGTGTAVPSGAVTLSTSLTLSFTGTDNAGLGRFECDLDGVGFSTCTSPVTYSGLGAVQHTFEVRAVDTSSNTDLTPARYAWTVEAAPDTSIAGATDGRGKSITNGGSTSSSKLTLRFAGTDNGTIAGFECRLDAGQFSPCTSPVTYTTGRGTHRLRVRAFDDHGFRDATPAEFTWTKR